MKDFEIIKDILHESKLSITDKEYIAHQFIQNSKDSKVRDAKIKEIL